ncbi:hypothetical protein C8R45DRAFT_117196 [Mycena sanguinolenta]|nr:hypothetical protein C8R45DRAFT_117196 [Mycena sanguinolenta]
MPYKLKANFRPDSAAPPRQHHQRGPAQRVAPARHAHRRRRRQQGRGAHAHAAHGEACPGCVGARERARWVREVSAADEDADVEMEEVDDDGEEDESPPVESASPSAASASEDDNASSHDDTSRASDDVVPWPEWDAPAWKGHRFDGDEGWEWKCDGVQDVIFEGETDMRHGIAWHHYEYAGRVRPWDGLIGLIMRPRDRTLGLATFFISGNLVGRDTLRGRG